MNEHIPGVHVPDGIIRELDQAKTTEDREKRSIETCARIIRAVRPYCQGIRLMPMGWAPRPGDPRSCRDPAMTRGGVGLRTRSSRRNMMHAPR